MASVNLARVGGTNGTARLYGSWTTGVYNIDALMGAEDLTLKVGMFGKGSVWDTAA